MSQTELQRVVAEMNAELERCGIIVEIHSDDLWRWIRAIEAAQAVAPGGGEVEITSCSVCYRSIENCGECLCPGRMRERLLSNLPESGRWITQTTFYDSEQPDACTGNCTEAAIASILGVQLGDVPKLAGLKPPEFWLAIDDFMESHAIELHRMGGNYQPEGMYLASGQSARGCSHMVVMENGKLLHDPHPSRVGLITVEHVWLLVPRDPAAPASDEMGSELHVALARLASEARERGAIGEAVAFKTCERILYARAFPDAAREPLLSASDADVSNASEAKGQETWSSVRAGFNSQGQPMYANVPKKLMTPAMVRGVFDAMVEHLPNRMLDMAAGVCDDYAAMSAELAKHTKPAASSAAAERVCMECGTSYPDGKACPTNHDAEQEQAGEDYLRKFEADNARFVEALPRKLTWQADELPDRIWIPAAVVASYSRKPLPGDNPRVEFVRRAARVEVTDAMVERALRAFDPPSYGYYASGFCNGNRQDMRAALTAALEPEE